MAEVTEHVQSCSSIMKETALPQCIWQPNLAG